jgi:hypothetical protein
VVFDQLTKVVSHQTFEPPFIVLIEENPHDLTSLFFHTPYLTSLSEHPSNERKSIFYDVQLEHPWLIEEEELAYLCIQQNSRLMPTDHKSST